MLILFQTPHLRQSDLIGIFSRFLKMNLRLRRIGRSSVHKVHSIRSKLPMCFGHMIIPFVKNTQLRIQYIPGTDFCRKIGQENSRIFPDMYPERNAFRVTRDRQRVGHFKVSIPIEPDPRSGRSRRTGQVFNIPGRIV